MTVIFLLSLPNDCAPVEQHVYKLPHISYFVSFVVFVWLGQNPRTCRRPALTVVLGRQPMEYEIRSRTYNGRGLLLSCCFAFLHERVYAPETAERYSLCLWRTKFLKNTQCDSGFTKWTRSSGRLEIEDGMRENVCLRRLKTNESYPSHIQIHIKLQKRRVNEQENDMPKFMREAWQ